MKHNTVFHASEIASGAPVLLRKSKSILLIVLPLTMTCALFFWNIYEAFAFQSRNVPDCKFNPIVSNEALTQIAAMLVAAWFVIRQISFSTIPHIGYTIAPSLALNLRASGSRKERGWLVTFSSDGTGAALIEDIYYEVELQSGMSIKEASYEEVRSIVIGDGLREFDDFILWKLSRGAAIVPNVERPIFEATMNTVENRFRRLDVIIFYRGRMGELWGKRICCIRGTSYPT